MLSNLKTVRLDNEAKRLVILDQTLLPGQVVYVEMDSVDEVRSAIRALKVRGAPAIGIAAGYGLYLAADKIETDSFAVFFEEFGKAKTCLASSRPTAVNLFAVLERMERVLLANKEQAIPRLKEILRIEAEAIRAEDAEACRKIGEYGLSLLRPGMGLLTHCNAGCLAASEYGTALAPIYLGQEMNYAFKVYADETRPLLQGARLTAFELNEAGVDVTLICDNMASSVMRNGWVRAVLVGCDRIAANGDTANKIGTSGVAILAHHYGIPFYVLGPTSTIDMDCPCGDSILLEERDPREVTDMWYERRMAPANIEVYNPAFDVTSHDLITAIVTEKGVIYPPFDRNLRNAENK